MGVVVFGVWWKWPDEKREGRAGREVGEVGWMAAGVCCVSGDLLV